MGKLILITGAARSGKSRLAVDMAKAISDKKVVFAATCIVRDPEMKRRVLLHKKARPLSWKTIEVKKDLAAELKSVPHDYKAVIIDCLTLYVSNLLIKGVGEDEVKRSVSEAAKHILKAKYSGIIVTNEVGSGIVPENQLARMFRDLAGIANQIVAEHADEAYMAVCGIPVRIK